MNIRDEDRPSAVSPCGTKQDGEALGRWSWVERRVWTDRMLTALESGVKGGKWFSLIDKVYSTGVLESSFYKVAANKGSAGVDQHPSQTPPWSRTWRRMGP